MHIRCAVLFACVCVIFFFLVLSPFFSFFFGRRVRQTVRASLRPWVPGSLLPAFLWSCLLNSTHGDGPRSCFVIAERGYSPCISKTQVPFFSFFFAGPSACAVLSPPGAATQIAGYLSFLAAWCDNHDGPSRSTGGPPPAMILALACMRDGAVCPCRSPRMKVHDVGISVFSTFFGEKMTFDLKQVSQVLTTSLLGIIIFSTMFGEKVYTFD